jgi:hypothetical protein
MFCKRGYQSIVCAEEAKLQKQKILGKVSLFLISYNDIKMRTYESMPGLVTSYLDAVLTAGDECQKMSRSMYGFFCCFLMFLCVWCLQVFLAFCFE